MKYLKQLETVRSMYVPGVQLGSIQCKQIVKWQHLSRIKARLLWLVEIFFSPIKTQQATTGTSAATYK